MEENIMNISSSNSVSSDNRPKSITDDFIFTRTALKNNIVVRVSSTDINSIKVKILDLEGSVRQLQAENKELHDRTVDPTGDTAFQDAINRSAALDAKIKKLENEVNATKKESRGRSDEIRELNAAVLSKDKTIAQHSDVIKKKDAEIQRIRKENEDFRKNSSGDVKEITQTKNSLREASARIKKLEAELQDTGQKISASNIRNGKLITERDRRIADLEKEAEAARLANSGKDELIAHMQSDLDSCLNDKQLLQERLNLYRSEQENAGGALDRGSDTSDRIGSPRQQEDGSDSVQQDGLGGEPDSQNMDAEQGEGEVVVSHRVPQQEQNQQENELVIHEPKMQILDDVEETSDNNDIVDLTNPQLQEEGHVTENDDQGDSPRNSR
jgi:hypothetical protein